MRARSSLLRALMEFHALHPGVTLHQVIAFLHVAEGEGQAVCDIAAATRFTQSTASRSLRANGPPDSDWAAMPALGLLEAYLAEWDGRSHQIFLSEKGRALCDVLDRIAGEARLLRPPGRRMSRAADAH
ncbi:MarR family winged helix-turn-helix transcriptional regulator [Phenylobacterium sp.]|uniref:MarR family winged helix-turn-helix transcriptional regulator n=1 Tax=Phenylobacterium sp. TaxID=1871053 RepID=UPI002B8E263C|nr:MarR family winged helix-turn-helix transcriptional regulator [Phenylobacterium sp.]HLZ74413.1 MarR family winged helix-turn-helix transcriptional regulator [Phenylobacterium sp.]